MSTSEEKIIARIERVKRQLNELGPLRPGSISRQYRKPKERQQPFYQISYTHKMKSRSEYLRQENLVAIRQETANFKRFKKLTEQWVDLALELSQLRTRLGTDKKTE
ncbi:MAG: hypothetical protein LC725_02465 [Lentisphaerae bacterium]|nr:hypothetical protein [Lentisphaerota bacterium]